MNKKLLKQDTIDISWKYFTYDKCLMLIQEFSVSSMSF